MSELLVFARLPWHRRTVTYVLATVALTLGVGLWYRRVALRRQRQSELLGELRRTKLAAIAAQMNPHFVFNALNSVQEFILARDVEEANAYLGRFARLMRLTLDLSRKDYVSVYDDVEAMRLYAELEERRFDGRVSAAITLESTVPATALIPPLLVQPHLENAFKHGMAGRRVPGGRIEVRYGRSAIDPDLLEVTVTDNGWGRPDHARETPAGQHAVDPNRSNGFGTTATAERLALLQQVEQATVSVVTEDLVGPEGGACGTRVRLTIRMRRPGAELLAPKRKAHV